MRIEVSINTNQYSGKMAWIEDGAINELTGNSYGDGYYRCVVCFECKPACVPPNELLIIIDGLKNIADVGTSIAFYASLAKRLYDFLKKCHGYRKVLSIKEHLIDISDDILENELKEIIEDTIEKELKAIARDVKKILEEK